MAKGKELDKNIEEINVNLPKKKVILGTRRTLIELRKGKLAKLYLTKNCPEDIKEDVNYYSQFTDCNVVDLDYFNDELGTLCKKPFAVSVIGLLK